MFIGTDKGRTHLIALGMNHKTASIELRERLAYVSNAEIMHCAQVTGVVVVSTCNRTEVYVEAKEGHLLLEWLARELQLDIATIKKYIYMHFDLDVAKHLMQVASGLDSMVLGEVEIFGQLKAAYTNALQKGYVTKGLSKLFESAFAVAKKVRTQTEIGMNPISVAYIAVRLAERIFAKLSEQVVLLIGAGDTAQLMLKHLAGVGVGRFIIANRTLANSQLLVQSLSLHMPNIQGKVELIELDQIPDILAHADIVVTTTRAPLPIVGKGMVERAIKARKYRAMFMIDLAVPRNIEPQVQSISDVYLYGIDDLQSIAAKHLESRQVAIPQAEVIIAAELSKFSAWLEMQRSISTIQTFRQRCEQVRDQTLFEAQQQLQNGKEAADVLQKFAHLLLNRLMHEPTIKLRDTNVNMQRLFEMEID